MVSQDSHGLHHFHRRKRIHQKLEKYPHPNKWKKLMDHLIYVIVFVGPIMTIPQVTKIWIEKNATGVSAISWLTYFVTAVFWLIYATMHKEKPLIVSSVIWVFLDILIVVGTLVYG
jgi:uncharacterized protein with PQ loop repeat